MKKTILAAAAVMMLAPTAWAEEASPLTANLSVVSDYRFRGISQTFRDPAIQGGFDYAHPSGFYLGNWNSSISSEFFPNSSGIEMDFYGGYKFEPIPDVTADIGLLYYYYPGARYLEGTNNGSDFNNGEIYFGASYKWLSAKYFYTLTDYFGLNAGNGDSKGSGYLDLNATFEVAPKTTLSLHAGRQTVKNYGAANYNDYKVAVARDVGFGTLSLAVVDTDTSFYTASTRNGKTRDLGATGVVLSFTKAF